MSLAGTVTSGPFSASQLADASRQRRTLLSSSSPVCVMNHNWSAGKQCLHLQGMV